MLLNENFYNRASLEAAPELLGKLLVHKYNKIRLSAKIVEVEAYMGPDDKAAHSYNNRRTKRNEVMYGPPGHAYVYIIYGMHYCMNVITSPIGTPHGILIRAVEPVDGLDQMSLNRYNKPLEALSKSQFRGLTNGPGKLCHAMAIDLSLNGSSLQGSQIWIEEPEINSAFKIATSPRVNIDYSQEAAQYPWRFYISGNTWVSKP